jgi:hypothetical protein
MRSDPYFHVWQLHAGVDVAALGGTAIKAGRGRTGGAGRTGRTGRHLPVRLPRRI